MRTVRPSGGKLIIAGLLILGATTVYFFYADYQDPDFKAYAKQRQYCDGIRHMETSWAKMYYEWKWNRQSGC